MAICAYPTESGLSFSSETPSSCGGYLLIDSSEYQNLLHLYNIEASEILYVFSWGFGVILFFWSLGAAIGVAKRVIKMA